MAVENGAAAPIAEEPVPHGCYLQSFDLYETRSNFYLFGSDESRTSWRVLKIDRSEPSELNIREDFSTYTQCECFDLLKRIDEGNRSTGGLKFVTTCYGIIGFVKFLGPYYMLLITERKQIGAICGHAVYKITKTDMIMLPNSCMQSNLVNKDENRYKKLLCTIDLTKDFFFSYSYHIMRSLQKNLRDKQKGQALYETMFVWNEFLTRGIRNHLKNTLWTVALVYGFFKQDTFSISGRDFLLTLIARRSRHYAGTRYLKRGVNEKGRVANDVETEQIVSEEIPGVTSTQISSVVQNRGSIPLFWSQETSKLNIKPDIILHHKDKNFEATRLHFENLVNRYGNPIIILNLIKRHEKRPRESLLHREFDRAIKFLNNSLTEENHLRFLHWDLNKNSRNKAKNVLTVLVKVALQAISLTGFFYCQVIPTPRPDGAPILNVLSKDNVGHYSSDNNSNSDNTDDVDTLCDGSQEDVSLSSDVSGHAIAEDKVENSEICIVKPAKFQNGVVRTNCIDCLDRTNVAQYAYGLAALGHQLHALDIIAVPEIDLDDPLAKYLMCFYERMGDTLAQQYGGSAAHNKIFSERRGHLKLAIQSQEFFRTLQRYYSNAYMDANKQAAINLFLGYFQPQEGKPAIWELDSDQHCNLGYDHHFPYKTSRSFIKRSLSDGNILRESSSPLSSCDARVNGALNKALSDSIEETSNGMNKVSYSRTTPTIPLKQLLINGEYTFYYEPGDSNFLNLDSLYSSGWEEETYERSTAASTPVGNLSLENVINGIATETSTPPSVTGIKGKQSAEILEYDASQHSAMLSEFNESFVNWVIHGDTLCR
ncbi:phosphoinositide phosphatase SAC3-like [Ananas comosus]|uniref:Phosphoinositide phosphatase SAC3-like n=1 Tax=Ananas comosus TaxID=4615 RepID=A0A6P5F3L3_ANACO|nr:phosphoinositide phosphatase SAC3-like [Ananas comosus]